MLDCRIIELSYVSLYLKDNNIAITLYVTLCIINNSVIRTQNSELRSLFNIKYEELAI